MSGNISKLLGVNIFKTNGGKKTARKLEMNKSPHSQIQKNHFSKHWLFCFKEWQAEEKVSQQEPKYIYKEQRNDKRSSLLS